jgi:hydrogenase maturation protease
MGKTLVVCIGNDLAADDGVGLAVYRILVQKELPIGTRLRFLGVGGIDLLDEIEGEDCLVVVDAVRLGAPPGTVHILGWEQLPSIGSRPVSGHGIGIREAIEVGRRLYPEKTPRQVYLVGIEGKCFDRLGADLSDEVVHSVETATAQILHLLQ